MPEWLQEQFRKKSEQLWKKSGTTASLSLRFGGAIQCLETPESAAVKLAHLSARLATAKAEDTQNTDTLPTEATPVPEDFIDVTYRALTAGVLSDRPIDFSNAPMLKRGVKLLDGQTVFKDHETYVDNWVGRVSSTYWDETTKGIPPGINSVLRLDSIKDPMTVRGVLQGALHSASVTVSFEWKPSHPKMMDEGTFWNNLGNGEGDDMVRIVVTKINQFLEISLVWQGADQYAKQIGADGKVVQQSLNPEVVQLSAADPLTKELNMDLIAKLKKLFGVETEIRADNVEELFAKHSKEIQELSAKEKADAVKLVELKAADLEVSLAAATAKADELTKDLLAQASDAALGKKFLEDERKEATRLCKLAKGDDVSPAILTALEKADLEVVQAFKQEFEKEYEKAVPLTCPKCHATGLTRQSSSTETSITPQDEQKKIASFTPETAAKINSLHN